MRDAELTYEWLEFLSLQKTNRSSLLKEQETQQITYKASQTNPDAAQSFGDFEYTLKGGNNDTVKIVSSNIPLADAQLKCATTGKIFTVKFHQKYINNLQNAYYEGSKGGYCPNPGGNTFAPRKVRSPSSLQKPVEQRKLSNHSFGVAIDFDPTKNPYNANTVSEMEQHPEFIEAFEKNGFRWLGRGAGRNGPGDDMHFDLIPGAETGGEFMDTTENPSEEIDSGNFWGQAFSGVNKALGLNESKKINKKIFKIIDKTEEQIYDEYQKYFDSLLEHLRINLKLTKPVKIILEEDKKNAKKVLGRTGGYINQKNKIHIFCTDRHIKDIMRSLAHELVHHKQNIRGEFEKHEPTKHGYAQSNKHLRNMEKEAYLKGNILFRDWEDNYKYRGEK